MMLFGRVLLIFIFIMSGSVAFARIWRVPEDIRSISGAVSNAEDGDEIIVSPGTYHERVGFKQYNIYIHSIDPTNRAIVDNTAINGEPCVSLNSMAPPTARLSGFKL